MNMDMRIIVMEIIIAGILVFSGGCASYISQQASSRELNSIRAVQVDNGAGIGVYSLSS